MNDNKPDTSRAATNVPEFFGELDGGQLEHMLSVALSETAAAVVDREKKGELNLKLTFEHVKGTNQVRIKHVTKFKKPASSGHVVEDSTTETVMHVGRFGKLTIAAPQLPGMEHKRAKLPG